MMHPVLNAPGDVLLKLRCDESLSNFAFSFNVCRYTGGDSLVRRYRLTASLPVLETHIVSVLETRIS
jgi:hypothetical protein